MDKALFLPEEGRQDDRERSKNDSVKVKDDRDGNNGDWKGVTTMEILDRKRACMMTTKSVFVIFSACFLIHLFSLFFVYFPLLLLLLL